MIEKLYLYNDGLTMDAVVLSCEPEDNGHYHVRLAATLFHPQGGGQPSDIGYIGDAVVLQVIHEEQDVIHITDKPVAPGECSIIVDAISRELNTRMHSAGHLIAVAGEALGWKAFKANHRPGEGRVVFALEKGDAMPPTVEALEEGSNKLVCLALARRQEVINGIRNVGWGDLPAYECGGTHVTSTERVGAINIISARFKKGQLSVSYTLS
ncbi:alanyl-tRNA editing protein [Pectobacterium actinidiae]|uniref:Alanyl-tRNA editing protein n=1 Tax=Pectobacterium actinidiae TaxID=1507808 RepID=A0ABW8G5X1_9GAMM